VEASVVAVLSVVQLTPSASSVASLREERIEVETGVGSGLSGGGGPL